MNLDLLVKEGVPFDTAKRVVANLQSAEAARKPTHRIYDWAALLHPLERAIAAVASSAYRWRLDTVREPVYSAYLLTLRRTKQRIKAAAALNLREKSIPDVAASQKNPVQLDGLIWHAWVPEKVKAALLQAFDDIYNKQLATTGKRIIPFSTHIERSTTDARWLLLETRVLKLRAQHASDARMHPEVVWLDMALELLRTRRVTDKAVVQWQHLLPKAEQEKRKEWVRATGTGDFTPPSIAKMHDIAHMNAQRREEARKKQAEYQKKYRQKHKVQVCTLDSQVDEADDANIEAERERKRTAWLEIQRKRGQAPEEADAPLTSTNWLEE
jgi:hypothetical protein